MTKRIKKHVLSLTRPHRRRLFFIVFISLLSGSVSASTDVSPDFCGSLKEIIASGQKQFKSIRGKLDLVSEEHFGKLIPPGMKECFGWRDGKAYHCSSEAGLSPDEVGKRYDGFNHAIHQCLPDEWLAKEVRVNRVSARRSTTYTSASETINLRVSERNKRLGWYVDFYFRR